MNWVLKVKTSKGMRRECRLGRKAASEIMFILVLLATAMLSLAFNIQPAKSEWTGTVYIRADGSIDPPDAPIRTYDNITYTLIDDITSSADGIVAERDNIIIDGAGYVLQGTGAYLSNGIYLLGRSNVTIKNVTIKNFWWGITLNSTSKVTLCGNNIAGTNSSGIMLDRSSNNTISSNTITNNLGTGIYLGTAISFAEPPLSDYNIITENNVTNNQRGIYLYQSSNNTMIGNNIANNDYGIWLWHHSDYNKVSGNTITKNHLSGIYLSYSFRNEFLHNNFIYNTYQVELYESGYANFWDDGYPSGGNYWSDYTGVDLFSGSYQNETGSDGIGDAPYIIDENNVDRYPLMGPFNGFNTSVEYSVNIISNSTIEDFKYFDSNNTIVMYVSNMTADQTAGFCRLAIPHDVISPPYTVKVNDTTIEYRTIYENHTEGISIIYFTYEHSKLEITIIPEYPSMTIMLLLSATLLTTALRKRKLQRRKCIKELQT